MNAISVFDIFKIGVGPSSSHTLGPWRAAQRFLKTCRDGQVLERVQRVQVDLYGSLAKTGKGHGTDVAVVLGLRNEDPVTCDVNLIPAVLADLGRQRRLPLDGGRSIGFDPGRDVCFHAAVTLPFHPNGLTFTAFLDNGTARSETYFSIGGGFVVQENEPANERSVTFPRRIDTAQSLLEQCRASQLSVPALVLENELSCRSLDEIHAGLQGIWHAMRACVFRGCHTEGQLPGGLAVHRRAAPISRRLLDGNGEKTVEGWMDQIRAGSHDFQTILKWVSCFALAVNEENASFGRVVTAPTNGAAGVVPAVLTYFACFCGVSAGRIEEFLLTAGEIGSLFKKGATLSAAMGGCQAEIGVSSAMAAAGLTQCLGGSTEQVLMAAEIAMEHHLGLTCDPVGGLVQIPCIERNTMGATKAITAAHLALESDPSQARVSLDAVIKSMWETALDMNGKYKETAEGGLALQVSVNLSEC